MTSDSMHTGKGNPHPKKRFLWRRSLPLLDPSIDIIGRSERRSIQSTASVQHSRSQSSHRQKKSLISPPLFEEEEEEESNSLLTNPKTSQKPAKLPKLNESLGRSYSKWSESQTLGELDDSNQSESLQHSDNDPEAQAEESTSTSPVVTTTAASVLLLMRYSVTDEALQSLSCKKPKSEEELQSVENDDSPSITEIDSPLPVETTSLPQDKSQDDNKELKKDPTARRASMPESTAPTSEPKAKCPTRLVMPEDPNELNSLHCFVRAQLLEVFTLPSQKEEPGRAGLRCVFCAHLPRKDRSGTTMCTFHPKSLSDLYRGVMTWQRLHFRVCKHVPKKLRDEYWKHKESDQTRGKTNYWVSSAMRLGLKDIDNGRNGICYVDPEK